MRLTEDTDLIQALPAERPDQTFRDAIIRVCKRRCLRCSADPGGSAYGATIRDMGHREHVKCGQAAVGK